MNQREYFCDCIRECEKSMYAVAFSVLKNDNDVPDVVQDAILKAYSNLDTLKEKDKLRSWIMRIVHNTAVEYIRKRHDTVDIDTQEQAIADTEPNVDIETKMTVWEAVKHLKQPFRSVVTLFYYEDCSIRQISQITSTPESTVRVRLSRGRKILAELLKKEDFLE